LLSGHKYRANGVRSIRAFGWCSNEKECSLEHGSLSEIPSCMLHHAQVSFTRDASVPETVVLESIAETALDVAIPAALADLIPTYIENRRREAQALASAVASSDFQGVDRLAQRMIGAGSMYGFDRITLLGRRIRKAAENKLALELLASEYGRYLSEVRIAYAEPLREAA
jgi:hypothetical protein